MEDLNVNSVSEEGSNHSQNEDDGCEIVDCTNRVCVLQNQLSKLNLNKNAKEKFIYR